ncbi:TPM domain-containing protein [Uruburuella testudinis]|uniref:TPM domain-containing protein n=1 Tax=Uruburuella testudinis TaxID=1282863 RepID=A0ABY4DQI1_9NEIS|nr:TPM domain-containing protein [Uruburuella testudinis]UOO81318.1 TPM domain-containing protein [Uruburuella testudinis]
MQEQNKFKRLWQHWLHPRGRVERYFPTAGLQRISRDIGLSEQKHTGQIRFVIESRYSTEAVLKRLDTRTRAWQWFGELGVWDTEHNSGVLVYVSFADHAVEIVADRGIAAKVDSEEWQHACETILSGFKRDEFVPGLANGLQEVNDILVRHFPRSTPAADNELSDEVVFR